MSDWSLAKTPMSSTLYDVVTIDETAYAVGVNGTVLQQTDDGYEYVLRGGPNGNGTTLHTAATSVDGERVWFAGSSGVLGVYDTDADAVADRSDIDEVTGTLKALTVTGQAWKETVIVADTTGEITVLDAEGGLEVVYQTAGIGGGSDIVSIDLTSDGSLFATSENGKFYWSPEPGTWEELADATNEVPEVSGHGTVAAAIEETGSGVTYDTEADQFERFIVNGDDLTGIAACDDYLLMSGSRGEVCVRKNDGSTHQDETPATGQLHGIACGDPDIACGNGGQIIHRE